MPDIVHRVGIRAPQEKVFKALATREGLKGWWTKHIKGESTVGSVLHFGFPDGGPQMKVKVLRAPQRVQWVCVDGIEEWIGTRLTFDMMKGKGGMTYVAFSHRGWKKESAMFGHCSLKWGAFLISFKQYVETGRGRPFPRDIKIEDQM